MCLLQMQSATIVKTLSLWYALYAISGFILLRYIEISVCYANGRGGATKPISVIFPNFSTLSNFFLLISHSYLTSVTAA